ncbi:MAG TPA: CRTAC1 family protein [Thermoanaerobaculia bacterium]|nr:CRTAC1 family protein [Thermoanaerobaculia bacterium]
MRKRPDTRRTSSHPSRNGTGWPCGLVLGLSVAAGVLSVGAFPAGSQEAPPETPREHSIAPQETTAHRVAKRALDEIAAREGTSRSSAEILTRNLTRYFILYPIPEDISEMQRVLGTAERMIQQAAGILYRGARSVAEQEGAPAIRVPHVRAVIDRLLPRSPERWATYEYFPASTPTPLETWDLAAMMDTGLAWGALGGLADTEIAPAPTLLPLEEDAATTLAEAINAYALLLFRLGGEHARAELATHLRSDHLRSAGKTISERARGAPAPIAPGPPPAPAGSHFTDVTEAAGIDFRHDSSDWLGRFRRYGPIAPTFSGGGVAARDVDGDQRPDLVLCGGHGCVLFRNEGDGRFSDRTAESGIRIDGEARMPLLVDLDNDGDADLFVTYARDTNRLLLNDGEGRFRDATAGSGLEREGDISGPAVAVDVDNDGLLDLYVGNFGDYLSGASAWISQDAKNAQANRLYRNLGLGDDGAPRFEEIGERAGVADVGWAQAVGHSDVDRDGDQDLYVANDFGRNQLYRNRGDGTFEPAGEATGSDDPHHGMNVSFADLNGDAYPDLFVTNIWFWAATTRAVTETNSLLLSEAAADGAAEGLRYRRLEEGPLVGEDSGWSWAALFLDVENDGDDDLLVVNGFTEYLTFVQYREHPERPGELYPINNGRDPNMLFVNDGGRLPDRLIENSGIEIPGVNSRAIALLDYDGDGDLDAAITTFHERARLFRNDAGNRSGAGHWLGVRLVGDPARGVSRDAIGAVIVARTPDGESVWRQVSGGEGYLGMSSPEISIGLGAHRSADLEITWPGGATETLAGVAADRRVVVRQGAGRAEPATSPDPP